MDAVQKNLPHEALGKLQPHEVLMGYPRPLFFHLEACSHLNKGEMDVREHISRKETQDAAVIYLDWILFGVDGWSRLALAVDLLI